MTTKHKPGHIGMYPLSLQNLDWDRDNVNPDEAPPGYRAVPLSTLRKDCGNFCRQCDWRPECNAASPEVLLTYGNRCRAGGVPATGYPESRMDGVNVVFKKR